jgi:hypothetical protein
VDSRHLLRSDLLPLSLAGLFIHFERHKYPEYLARPASAAGALTVSGDISFIPSASPECCRFWEQGDDFYRYHINDYCNGLFLLTGNYVVNPATRQWRTLPTCLSDSEHLKADVWYKKHLVYDPMQDPYYKVFSISGGATLWLCCQATTQDFCKPNTPRCEYSPLYTKYLGN